MGRKRGKRQKTPLIWFEMDEEKNPVLVKENGERFTSAEKSKMFNMTVQSQQGWRRSQLYMDVNNIWDATAFGAEMSVTLAYGPDSEGRYFTFTSCEEADRRMYKNLTKNRIRECRRNVNAFYKNPELQKEWQQIILHPICLILRSNGSLEPVSLAELDPVILEKYDMKPIRIGEMDCCSRIFETKK